MHGKEIPIVFQPQGRRVYVLPGTSLLEAATRAGLTLNAPCGGNGTCGKCRVRITKGAESTRDAEHGPLGAGEFDQGVRLACKTLVTQPLTVDIPASSLADGTFKALGSGDDKAFHVQESPIRKALVELTPPSLENAQADSARLREHLGAIRIDATIMRTLPGILKNQESPLTAITGGKMLLALEAGDTRASHLAAAFDIGTTTIAGVLLDLSAGQEITSTTRMNPQAAYGDDVLARISHASSCHTCLGDLQQMVLGAVGEMLTEMAGSVGRSVEEILDITLAGNTTMQHLLMGVNPESLGHVPFAPVFTEAMEVPARQLGLHIHHAAQAYIFPSVGGFVGGDTVACLVATNLHLEKGPVLLVDVGTNGELVLAREGKLTACSTAAGPAFEGAKIRHGMRAHNGAIEKVLIRDGEVQWNVIGNVPPVGICGSALLDTAAELRRHGILDETGRLLDGDEMPPATPDALRSRVIEGDAGQEFIIARASETRQGEPITLTQKDLREMQLAVAAIRAGINILLAEAGLKATDLEKLLLAGGFGNYIRRSNAQVIGLLPMEMERHRIQFIGNASLVGAKRAAVSAQARETASAISQTVRHVELSNHPEFQNEYAEAMFMPDVVEDEPAKSSESRRLVVAKS